MGHMLYDGKDHEFDDRVLAHIKAAVGLKFRRQEAFYLSWNKKLKEGDGRIAIWVTPYATLTFRFSGGRQPELNPVWLRVLEETGNHPYGMQVVPEDVAEERRASRKGNSNGQRGN